MCAKLKTQKPTQGMLKAARAALNEVLAGEWEVIAEDGSFDEQATVRREIDADRMIAWLDSQIDD